MTDKQEKRILRLTIPKHVGRVCWRIWGYDGEESHAKMNDAKVTWRDSSNAVLVKDLEPAPKHTDAEYAAALEAELERLRKQDKDGEE